MQDLEPQDWDPQEARRETDLARTSPLLAVLIVLGVVILMVIVAVLLKDFAVPLVKFVDDWARRGP